jgi:hypothetical protein
MLVGKELTFRVRVAAPVDLTAAALVVREASLVVPVAEGPRMCDKVVMVLTTGSW